MYIPLIFYKFLVSQVYLFLPPFLSVAFCSEHPIPEVIIEVSDFKIISLHSQKVSVVDYY